MLKKTFLACSFATIFLLPLSVNGEGSHPSKSVESCVSTKQTPTYSEEFLVTQKLAKQGDVQAQLKLAQMYTNANGVAKSYNDAFKWYKAASEQGNAIAQYHLAFMYMKGLGTERNMKEAKKWYGESCYKGYRMSCENHHYLDKSGY